LAVSIKGVVWRTTPSLLVSFGKDLMGCRTSEKLDR